MDGHPEDTLERWDEISRKSWVVGNEGLVLGGPQ